MVPGGYVQPRQILDSTTTSNSTGRYITIWVPNYREGTGATIDRWGTGDTSAAWGGWGNTSANYDVKQVPPAPVAEHPGYRCEPGQRRTCVPPPIIFKADRPHLPIMGPRQHHHVRQPPCFSVPRRWRSRVISHGMRSTLSKHGRQAE